jgi:endonuclease YncB( thermonuclease family)
MLLSPCAARCSVLLALALVALGPRSTPAEPGRGVGGAARVQQPAAPAATAERWAPAPPAETFEVVRVVDGDTVHIQRQGELQKLRLLSVDTEEKLAGRAEPGGSKPETVYGQLTADWAQRYFAEHALVDGTQRIGLLFPGGVETRDVYGRLLCHVLLPDGTDFNLFLVRTGRSPYFNKYGNSELCHQAFVLAQREARAAELGIWDPSTNRAEGPQEHSVARPYALLLPWWDARAAAVDHFRAARAADPLRVAAADEPAQLDQVLAAAAERAAAGETAPAEEPRDAVFGSLDRLFREDDGSVTLLLRTGVRERACRARIAPQAVEHFDLAALEASTADFVQNYLWVRGTLQANGRGFQLWLTAPSQVQPAGPEPTY